jgi:hypothetical protein
MFKILVEDEDSIFKIESDELRYKFFNTIFFNQESGILILKIHYHQF